MGYADGLFSGGSTNIDGALQTALKMLNDKTRPNYVLFLTDGLPTVGEMNELNIERITRMYGKDADAWIAARNKLLDAKSIKIFTNPQLQDWGLDKVL